MMRVNKVCVMILVCGCKE